jgi:hypothetical protein
MKTRTDRHGNKLCEVCGIAPHDHRPECHPADILHESVRQVIARAMAQRSGADVATRLSLAAVAEFLTAQGLSIVDEELNIVEVL